MSAYPLVPLSHSSMDVFDTCPKQFFHKHVIKDAPFVETEAALWGTRVHDACEKFVKGESVDLKTLQMDDLEQVLTYLREMPADYRCSEYEWAISHDGQMTDFKGDNVFLRGYTDYEAVKGDTAWVIDYKTGKPHSKFEQVELYALTIWLRFPQVNHIRAGYMWLKDRTPGSLLTMKSLYRATDMQRIWNDRRARFEKIKVAFETEDFPAKPGKGRSKFPCGWCAIAAKGACDWANTEYVGK